MPLELQAAPYLRILNRMAAYHRASTAAQLQAGGPTIDDWLAGVASQRGARGSADESGVVDRLEDIVSAPACQQPMRLLSGLWPQRAVATVADYLSHEDVQSLAAASTMTRRVMQRYQSPLRLASVAKAGVGGVASSLSDEPTPHSAPGVGTPKPDGGGCGVM